MFPGMFPEPQEDNEQGDHEAEVDDSLDDVSRGLLWEWGKDLCLEESCENPEEQKDDKTHKDKRVLKEGRNVLECIGDIHSSRRSMNRMGPPEADMPMAESKPKLGKNQGRDDFTLS